MIAPSERTGIMVGDDEVLGYIPDACGSGSGSGGEECSPVDTEYCTYPVACKILLTFGGVFADVDPVVVTWSPGVFAWIPNPESPGVPPSISTPCGTIDALQFVGSGGGFATSISLAGRSINGGSNTSGTIPPTRCNSPFEPGGDPGFLWESGDMTIDGSPCGGTFAITATAYEGGSEEPGAGSQYVMGVTTGLDPVTIDDEDLDVLAFVNCAGSGTGSGPNAGKIMYRTAWDTGIDLPINGQWVRLVAFKKLECCQEIVPEWVAIGETCCPDIPFLPAVLAGRLESTMPWLDGVTTDFTFDPDASAITGRPTWFGLFTVTNPALPPGTGDYEIPFFFYYAGMTTDVTLGDVIRCWVVDDFRSYPHHPLYTGAGRRSDLENYSGYGVSPLPSTCDPFERVFDVVRDLAGFGTETTLLHITIPGA